MKKILTQQFMGVLAGLASIILSVTLYAYRSDQHNIIEKIEIEKTQRIEYDNHIITTMQGIETGLKEDLETHKIQDDNQTKLLIKYLDQRFDDMEKLIQANHY